MEEPIFQRDACFDAHLSLRDQLIKNQWANISAQLPEAVDAVEECLEFMCDQLLSSGHYRQSSNGLIRPDGVYVSLEESLRAIAHLVVEDVLILNGPRGGHVLQAGVLAFPSRWSLREKLGRDLLGIHRPVSFYRDHIAPRVQRFFDALRPEVSLWRVNWLFYPVPDYFMPGTEEGHQNKGWETSDALFLRTERQTLIRLARSGAVVFTIKTDICPVSAVPDMALKALPAALEALAPAEADYKARDEVLPRVKAELSRRGLRS